MKVTLPSQVKMPTMIMPVAASSFIARVSNPEQLKAALRVPETLAKDVQFGQKVEIDTRNGIIPGTVVRIDPAVVARLQKEYEEKE